MSQRHTKVSIITVPLYLLIVLFPPLLAVCAVGVGVLIAELVARRERASQPLDIVRTTGRWIVVATLGTMDRPYPTKHWYSVMGCCYLLRRVSSA